jgi:hypothetical protein
MIWELKELLLEYRYRYRYRPYHRSKYQYRMVSSCTGIATPLITSALFNFWIIWMWPTNQKWPFPMFQFHLNTFNLNTVVLWIFMTNQWNLEYTSFLTLTLQSFLQNWINLTQTEVIELSKIDVFYFLKKWKSCFNMAIYIIRMNTVTKLWRHGVYS